MQIKPRSVVEVAKFEKLKKYSYNILGRYTNIILCTIDCGYNYGVLRLT